MSKMGTLNILREIAIKEARENLDTLIKFYAMRGDFATSAHYFRQWWRFQARWGKA